MPLERMRIAFLAAGQFEEANPQGLKPALILLHLLHPSGALRAGFEIVP